MALSHNKMTKMQIRGLMDWLIRRHYKELTDKLKSADEAALPTVITEVEKALRHREDLITVGKHPACSEHEFRELMQAFHQVKEAIEKKPNEQTAVETDRSYSPRLYGSQGCSQGNNAKERENASPVSYLLSFIW